MSSLCLGCICTLLDAGHITSWLAGFFVVGFSVGFVGSFFRFLFLFGFFFFSVLL